MTSESPFLSVSMALLTITLSNGCKDTGQSNREKSVKVEDTKLLAWITGPAGKIFVDHGASSSKALAGPKPFTSGLPVVIVHSLAGNTTQWQPQLEHLRRSRRAVAFDMRGHGQSEPAPNHDYSFAAMAQDLSAVIDSLDLRRFVLIGHSYGGGVIAVYAGMHPERVAGLLFVDPIGDTRKIPQDEVDNWLSVLRTEAYTEAIETHWRTILINADSAVTQAVILSLRQTPKEVILGAFDNVFSFDPATARNHEMETGIDKRLEDILYKAASIYLGVDFIVAGLSNFSTDYDFDARFGYPVWIQIPIGVAETLAGFGLLFRRTNIASVLVLAVVMAGAVFSHLKAQDGGYGTPLKYLLYFGIMLYYRGSEIKNRLKN